MSVLKPSRFRSITAADLIIELDKNIPHRCIGPDETIDHARFYAGKRDLIDSLLAQLKREDQ